ncbi:hypothetical protein R9X47_03690 [Wukongibacter baidiensis]|uniref:hypothetical protein n=1 Tax=Wukongibacter baidiensis TaxID=1723361 RepID=UPI003D7F2D1C
MKPVKISTIQNLCSQGNVVKSRKATLSQYNHMVLIGLEKLNDGFQDSEPIPIYIRISKDGELEIIGLNEGITDNDGNINIYSDKKVTRSKR